MPNNAIIKANGTGDYTSPIAWEAGEQSANYGSITIGRLDGFFDLGSSNLDFNGTWTNGARLECFSVSDGFDGTERSLCGVTSANTAMSVRGRATLVELVGLEIYNTSTGEPYQSTTGTPSFSHTGCLFHNPAVNVAIPVNLASSSLLTNCVTVAKEHSTQVFNHIGCNHFSNTTSSVGAASGSITNTVVVNALSGECIRVGITQSNNATTDTSGDTLTNIVIADNFVSSDPVGDGDYRIKSGSPLDTNGIGSFVESGGAALEVTPSATSTTSAALNPSIVFNSPVTVIPLFTVSRSQALPPTIEFKSQINLEPLPAISESNALSPSISFSAILNITPNAASSESNALNPVIEFASPLFVNPEAASTLSFGINPTITFSSAVNVSPEAALTISTAIRPSIQIGEKFRPGEITAGYKKSGIGVKYKLNGITVNFK